MAEVDWLKSLIRDEEIPSPFRISHQDGFAKASIKGKLNNFCTIYIFFRMGILSTNALS